MDPKDQKLLRAVGRRIAELRAQGGETQEEFAERYGATVKYVQAVELGSENLTLLTLRRFGDVLGAGVAELLEPPASMKANPGRPPGRREVPGKRKSRGRVAARRKR